MITPTQSFSFPLQYNESKNKKASQLVVMRLLVSATGFEPVTVCLEGRCSIQLSYAPISGKFFKIQSVSKKNNF